MTQARWLVQVDWNDDGDFSDADEDVTADVLGMTLEHRRDLSSEHIEAARLELELKNHDHKYSPPNASSPLSGQLKPGRAVRVRAAYPYDSLSGEAGARLGSHLPDHDAGWAWTEHLRGFRIASGGAGVQTHGAPGGGPCVATLDFGDPDVSIGCDFERGLNATVHGGLCFRYSNVSNYLYARVTGAGVELRSVDKGADSLIASASHVWPAGTTGFLQVVLHGSSIRVLVDDVELIDSETSFNETATRHGLFCGGGADHVWAGFGGWASLFRGSVDSIHPRPHSGAQYCYLRALDEMERLTSVTLYTYATSSMPQTSDEILGDILDYAGVDPKRRRMDTGAVLVPYIWTPSIWGVRAIDEVHRLQEEEDGFVYVDGHGYWRLENRAHRASAPHVSARAAIKDTDDGTNPYFSELEWDDGVDNVENLLFIRIRDGANKGAQDVWTLTETPRFNASETKEFLAESTAYDVVAGLLPPVENVDYEANSSRRGTGTDISGQLTVTHPNTADYNGKGTLIRVTFGASRGYLTLLKLRTLNAFRLDDPVLLLAEDAGSKGAYGRRIRSIDARWTRQVDAAQATIDHRLARRKDPRTVLNLVVPAGSKANAMLLLHRSISDRVAVSYPEMGVAGDFFIEGHRIVVEEGWTRATRELLLQSA